MIIWCNSVLPSMSTSSVIVHCPSFYMLLLSSQLISFNHKNMCFVSRAKNTPQFILRGTNTVELFSLQNTEPQNLAANKRIYKVRLKWCQRWTYLALYRRYGRVTGEETALVSPGKILLPASVHWRNRPLRVGSGMRMPRGQAANR